MSNGFPGSNPPWLPAQVRDPDLRFDRAARTERGPKVAGGSLFNWPKAPFC
jgi:hypothetical protein